MVVYGLESQGFIVVFALGLVARELVIGAAPFLSESGPVDFCAFDSDCGSDGRGAGVESFDRPPLEGFGYTFTPVDDGAEDLDRVRLRIRGGCSGLASKSSAFGRGFCPLLVMSLCFKSVSIRTDTAQCEWSILGSHTFAGIKPKGLAVDLKMQVRQKERQSKPFSPVLDFGDILGKGNSHNHYILWRHRACSAMF